MVKRPLKYVDEYCEKCGRMRVELYDSDEKICEKCGWNSSKKIYEDLDELAELEFMEKLVNDGFSKKEGLI